jgi:hypothetical protein
VNARPSGRAKPSCLGCAGRLAAVAVALVASLAVGAVALAVVLDGIAPGILDPHGAPLVRLGATREVAVAELGEDPHLAPQNPSGRLPLCRDVPPEYGHAFRLAFALMRGTEEGRRLYELLVDQGACVGVADIPFNAAYTSARGFQGDWSRSVIVVDRGYVRSLRADVLAAILVHEATHLDRAISHTACYYDDSCTTLPNGVEVEEEVAAHTAEAEWWLAAYGDDGKRFAVRTDYAENRLLRAYLRGPDAFSDEVKRLRSDPHEGDGI